MRPILILSMTAAFAGILLFGPAARAGDDSPPFSTPEERVFILRTAGNEWYMQDESVSIGIDITVKPVRAAILQGHIHDPASTATVKDARVTVIVRWENNDIPFYCATDNRGDYNLPAVPPGRAVSIVVLSPGYVPQEHVLPTAIITLRRRQAVIHNISLVRGMEITGAIKNEDGEAIAGALVFLIRKDDGYNSDRSIELRKKFNYLTDSDDKGGFVLPPAPVDGFEYEVVVYYEEYEVMKKSYQNSELSFVLKEGKSLHPFLDDAN